ncbi:MAG: cytochrome c [Steroidobacteraceae bacterium]|nr:cytochrome c [Steroidobacteraceae bacterium]
MKIRIWVIGAALVVIAGAAFVVLGGYNVAADEPHWKLTSSLMQTVRERSIAARSADIVVPPLDDEAQIRTGAGNYDAMCAGCHLRPGENDSELRAGLYPRPPDLARHRVHDPAAAFWVIKHGIKMSGMPAWGGHMEDEYIWGLVAFMKRLPDMSEASYRDLVEASGGHSHGGMAAEEDHGPEDHHADEAKPASAHAHAPGTPPHND